MSIHLLLFDLLCIHYEYCLRCIYLRCSYLCYRRLKVTYFYYHFSVCTRSERKRKREEENTKAVDVKHRKLDKDEFTFRAEIECRLVGKLIGEIDALLDEYRKESNGHAALIQGPAQSVDEHLKAIEEFLASQRNKVIDSYHLRFFFIGNILDIFRKYKHARTVETYLYFVMYVSHCRSCIMSYCLCMHSNKRPFSQTDVHISQVHPRLI